ncbi:Ctf8-domain-containing protein [Absidia repens]|uniref:Ctf8-domain-containing protein n=1 Tax=Absidia repens TaxID=90262 RepID=A0A1X2IYG6_9FUNG|nr:Ctf8-domain-containing protein [Absidia repens]
MVQAVIHSWVTSDNKKELSLLEFQGSFHGNGDDQMKNVKIGDIEVDKDKMFLLIGHHRIEGVRKKLLKPLAVIHKRTTSATTMDIDQINDTGPAMEYDVTTIIKEKFVFTNRPRLIVKESLRGMTKF